MITDPFDDRSPAGIDPAPDANAPKAEAVIAAFSSVTELFGGAGRLDKEIAGGKVTVPTHAYRDEGTSYHYAPASDYVRIKNAPVVEAFMKQNGIPLVLGRTRTTDAFCRETVRNFERRKADGCVSVEMEGAAVQAVCDFRGIGGCMFFTGGDLPDAPEWTRRKQKDSSGIRSTTPGALRSLSRSRRTRVGKRKHGRNNA